jgi:20S proteasome alpha/beta subunit
VTTIAANRQMIAGDRKVTHDTGFYYARKVFRIRDMMVGVSGDAGYTNEFVAWLKKTDWREWAQPTLKKGDEFGAIVLFDSGRMQVWSGDQQGDVCLSPYYATGSGAHAAMAFMSMGLAPDEAVRRTRKIDNATGGRVDVLRPNGKHP